MFTSKNAAWLIASAFVILAPWLQSAQAETARKPGTTFKDCPDCPEMVVIPAGSFEMGSNNGSKNEQPVHRVIIKKPFAMGKTEVTQKQWQAIMGDNPSGFKDCGDKCPVERVSWNDAQEFIDRLNTKTGKQYRLPSEAEWEYACRAGGNNEYCGSDNLAGIGWYGAYAKPEGNSGKTSHVVGGKKANAFGLYDMTGNVYEWVEDSYHENYINAPTDGSAWDGDGKERVLRGSSWNGRPAEERATSRERSLPIYQDDDDGFRVVRDLP
jgi:formylglycine-generating enzyme required for sulfatase activity